MININKVSLEMQEAIIAMYKDGKSMRQIEKETQVSRTSIAKFLEEKQIKTTKGNHYRQYHHNENYFHNIINEHQAYWLGWMFADGYISNYDNRYGQDHFGLSLSASDIEVLEKFKKDLDATNPINTYERNGITTKGEPLSRIELTSQQTVNDLIAHGCEKQKSNTLAPPKNLPRELIPAFLRGFFEGDGSIVKSSGGPQYSDGYAYSINITTTYAMAEWIYNYFNKGSIVKDHRREHTWYYSLGGHAQVLEFYHVLYDNATIWMERKYQRFQELINKYTEK